MIVHPINIVMTSEYKTIEVFYENPVILRIPFKRDQEGNFRCYFYLFEYIQDSQCLMIVPSYHGSQIPVSYYEIKENKAFVPSFKNIFFQEERVLSERELLGLIRVHNMFAKMILGKFLRTKEGTECGSFREEITESFCEDIFFRNYIFFPVKNYLKKLFSIEKYLGGFESNFERVNQKVQ